MLARALLAASILAFVPVGCASAPEPVKPKIVPIKKGKNVRRAVRAAERAEAARRSELEPVFEEAPDPEAMRLFQRIVDQPALPLTRAASPPEVTKVALADTALGEAIGMKAAEQISGLYLKREQRASMPVTLEPGACETFIAQGGIGAIEVDLFLTTGERGARVLAQDTRVGPIAVIGGRGRCWTSGESKPIAAELHVVMREGAGVVLVRSFRRDR